MEIQIDNLIEDIKQKGILKAEEEARIIISNAQEKAKNILKDAEDEVSHLKTNFKNDSEKQQQSNKLLMAQAGRDLVLEVEQKISHVFKTLLLEELKNNLKQSDVIKELVNKVDLKEDAVITVSKEMKDQLMQLLKSDFQDKVKKGGLSIKTKENLDGFELMFKDGKYSYEITPQKLSELFMPYLNENLRKVFEILY